MTGPEPTGSPKTPESVSEAYRKAQPWVDASWQLVGATGMWTLIGYWLDGRLGTRPWLLVGGAFLGMALGFWLFVRSILRLAKKEQEKR